MSNQASILVPAGPASALVFGDSLPWVSTFEVPDSGERTVHLARLRAHAAEGFSYDLRGPNCVLRWARVPAGHSGPVDVAVHFHGYKGHNGMRLATKAAASGLDLRTPGVGRPTLGVVPHGRAFRSRMAGVDGFAFPAISSLQELDGFIDEALAALAAQTSTRPTRGRVVLTGHSGGGAALSSLMGAIGSNARVHGFQYFDATYGGQAALTARRGWLEAAIERDTAALAGLSGAEARRRYMETQGSHLRICYIDNTGTAAIARTADTFIRERLQALVPDSGLRELLRKHYRAQKVARPSQVGHNLVPRTFGGRLLADPGNDLAPEAVDTQPATPQAHGLSHAWEDPLGLVEPGTFGSGALGYGSSWDERIRSTVQGFLASFTGIPVQVGTQVVPVHPPYFMNAHANSAAATRERHRLATEHRAAAPAPLRALIGESRFQHARIGKSTPEMIRDLLQTADRRGLLQADATVNRSPTAPNLRRFLQHYGLGVDCSGFVCQAINKIIELFPGAAPSDRIAAAHSTGSASLKGGQGAFERVSDPVHLCAGDTMWLSGHIRILAWSERRGDLIVFCTAESRSSNPRDVGPSIAYWRLVPDRQAGNANFSGWRLERSQDLNAPDSGWTRSNTTHVYGHYRPLRRLLQAAGVTPAALQAAPAAPQPSTSRAAPAAPPPRTVRPVAPAPVAGGTTPPRTAITRDLTQDEVDRLAAVRFRNASDIETFFRRSGQASFVDWYNAGLAHSAPFRARGAMAVSPQVRTRFTTFWNQVRLAFDRDEISALDFAAFTAISINETSGNLWAHPESSGRAGGGRRDSRGEHRGLAYFFDRIELRPGHFKASYNHLSGGKTAGALFNDADFIDAHGTLGCANLLANRGGDYGGAWNGHYYPQAQFDTQEVPANGFIMQADFYKFRGRGVIQTTGRSSYGRVVNFIKGYRGGNGVLGEYARRWTSYSNDVACTRSRTEDWDRIFEQPEILAKGLSLHAGTRDDYRQMNTTAATLLDVPSSGGNSRGRTGSIYAMGRRISGSGDYGRGLYRQRVLALMHGFLTV